MSYAVYDTELGKNGPGWAALAQFAGFRCQGTELLNPDSCMKYMV